MIRQHIEGDDGSGEEGGETASETRSQASDQSTDHDLTPIPQHIDGDVGSEEERGEKPSDTQSQVPYASTDHDISPQHIDGEVESEEQHAETPSDTQSQVSYPSTESSPQLEFLSISREDDEAEEALIRDIWKTPFEQVFRLNADKTKYKEPKCLKGVPVNEVLKTSERWDPRWRSLAGVEMSEYWNPKWRSLVAILHERAIPDFLLAEASAQLEVNRFDSALTRTRRKLSSAAAHFSSIEKAFGGPEAPAEHPNLLIAKEYLPHQGLCSVHILYTMARYVLHLKKFHERGDLAMKPWDFLRWRVAVKAEEQRDSEKWDLLALIQGIGGSGGRRRTRPYVDPAFKAALEEVGLGERTHSPI